MSLFHSINTLNNKQLEVVAENLGIKIDSRSQKTSKNLIKKSLREYYEKHREIDYEESFQIVALWRDYTREIINDKKVDPKNQSLKDNIIDELNRLVSRDTLNNGDRIETLVREILLLLWKETSENDRSNFIAIVKKDLASHQLKFTDEEINKNITFLLLGGIGSIAPILVPIISGVVLKRLTQGFIAWFAINILGKGAAQIALLGALSGPWGWAISGGTLGLGVITSTLKYNYEKKKLYFVQSILSIYAYRYQNRVLNRNLL